VGVAKRRVLQGLWRRLVGVGIIGPGLYGVSVSWLLALIHRSTWKGNSANFAIDGVLRSSHVTGPFAYSVRLRRTASVVA
jgi:hypothetical protein